MQLYALIFVLVTLIVVVVPMFVCDYEERFTHNVKVEFSADDKNEIQVKL